jgi:asparagine synthase (glutamine-hydrolysing)
MCGIFGFISNSNQFPDLSELRHANSQQQHRGPDEGNDFHQEGVYLAHRRLSIIDLKNGLQPMIDDSGRFVISYNGELYNYRELRSQLASKGYNFTTDSDTEVILKSYIEWGQSCVERFRGMFAFAILSLEDKTVFIARDHIGIKPLFYTLQNGFFAFSSELQSLKKIRVLKFEVDPQSIDEYLWLQYIAAPKTIFKNVSKLPPGHRMLVDFDCKIKNIEDYWNFEFRTNYNISEAECLEQADYLIEESIKQHLVSDVPFGAFLSGGIDSSLVVSKMSKLMDTPVKTFAIGFQDQEYNELKYARQVADKFYTEHFEEIVKPEGIDILPKLVKHYGEPFGDSSAIPTYYVSKMAANKVKMVLSGDGGDEAFAGYNSYKVWLNASLYQKVKPWKKVFHPVGRAFYPHKYLSPNDYRYWIEINRGIPYEQRQKLWRKEYSGTAGYNHPYFKRLFNEGKSLDRLQQAQFSDLKTYLPNDILTKVDIASMMNSLEVRTPLVDRKIWEFAATIPPAYNIKFDGTNYQDKRVLKGILSRQFDSKFIYRKKMGFSIPIEKWLGKESGQLQDLMSSDLFLYEYFEKNEVNQLMEHSHGRWKWLLLFLEFWLKDFHKDDNSKI